jgi:superfamily II DNA or RNA helicase
MVYHSKYTMSLARRNNTNFSMSVYEYLRGVRWGDEYSFLKYFQNLVRLYFTEVVSGSRGLLIMHEMGVGKTMQAIAIAISMRDKYAPVILSGKSLRSNMINGIKKYASMRASVDPDFILSRMTPEELDEWIAKNFSFVSMNAGNMALQLGKVTQGLLLPTMDEQLGEITKMASLDGKLVIVDEAHNLFRAITNGGKNGHAFYNMVMRSKDVRLLFLTGTPINSDPFEVVPCFNMLAGAAINTGEKSKRPNGQGIGDSASTYTPLLPETYREFTKLYVDKTIGNVKNRGKFQNRIFGMVSYVDRNTTLGAGFNGRSAMPVPSGASVSGNFPTELPTRVIRVHMSPQQYLIYNLARDKEHEESSGSKSRAPVRENPAMTKPKAETASTYRVKSRQFSNWASPLALDVRSRSTMTRVTEDGEIVTENISSSDGQVNSPKFTRILENIEASEGVGLVYSQFVGAGGLGAFTQFLIQHGWSPRGGGLSPDSLLGDASEPPEGFKRFAAITGDVPVEEREAIQKEFNSESNRDGSLIALLLVSSTGAEGLDLHRVRHIHVMEPYWNYARIAQIIARGVRNNSHIDLPEDKRNVQPYIYLSIPPASEYVTADTLNPPSLTAVNPDDNKTYAATTDVELYTEAIRSQLLINNFVTALKEVSIECLANAGLNCRVCAPTNKALFTENPALDVAAQDPCLEATQSKVSVKTVEVDATQYYYSLDPVAMWGFRVYVPAVDIGGFIELPETDQAFPKIRAEVQKIEGDAVVGDIVLPGLL